MEKERKIQIIKAAIKRFARHGLKKTTLEEIARDLRLGKATLYHYFVSKDELFYETLKYEISIFLSEVKTLFEREDIDPKTKLMEYFSIKEGLQQKYTLIYELIMMLLSGSAFDIEKDIFSKLLKDEENNLNDFMKKNRDLHWKQPDFIVFQSWSLFLSIKLNFNKEGTRSLKEMLYNSVI